MAQLATTASRKAHSTTFEGPAADRFRHEIDDCLRDMSARAAHLHRAATNLERAAASVAAAQAGWRARFRQVEAQLAAAARAAGHG